MTPVTDYYLLAHALEFRLLLALIIVPVTYAAIQSALFVGRTARSVVAKVNSLGSSNGSTAAYSAAGAR